MFFAMLPEDTPEMEPGNGYHCKSCAVLVVCEKDSALHQIHLRSQIAARLCTACFRGESK
jgi:hypothetical protein